MILVTKLVTIRKFTLTTSKMVGNGCVFNVFIVTKSIMIASTFNLILTVPAEGWCSGVFPKPVVWACVVEATKLPTWQGISSKATPYATGPNITTLSIYFAWAGTTTAANTPSTSFADEMGRFVPVGWL